MNNKLVYNYILDEFCYYLLHSPDVESTCHNCLAHIPMWHENRPKIDDCVLRFKGYTEALK